MAWLWWLLVPVVLTVVGSMLVAGQGILRSRRHVRARKDPIADHANFLRALPETSEQYPLPVTIVVSDETEPAVIETEATQSA